MFNYSWTPAAQFAMYVWPPLVFYYLVKKRKAFEATAFVLFVVAMLALPQNIQFDLPAVPPIDKESATLLVIFVYCVLKQRKRLRRAKLFRGLDILIVISILATLGTASTNSDPLTYGQWIQRHIRGLTFRDSLSMGIRDFVDFGLAFMLGRALFRTTDDLEDLIKTLTLAGLVYSLCCLIEIRLSPQMHRWVYGYAPHYNFAQTIRWGGYRPMVAMAHGLAVAMFMTAATMSAATLTRLNRKVSRFKLSARSCMLYLAIILIACKSTGAILYGLIFVPTVWRAKAQTIVRLAVFIALFVAVYPTLRALDYFPTEQLVSYAESAFGRGRAQSMEFRFENEDMLLEKAMQRQYFGWGGYGRGRIYHWDYAKELTIADGQWIIRLSQRGIVGTIGFFGLLLWPIFAMRKRITKIKDKRERYLVSGTTLILAVYCLDMVPNASYSVIPFIIAGALWTVSGNMVKGKASQPAYPLNYAAHPPPHYAQQAAVSGAAPRRAT